jgi:hypothetical protein
MIAAMLTLVVITLLMVVALMFAAEIGVVDPVPRGKWGRPSGSSLASCG